jgi:hypothetical protein
MSDQDPVLAHLEVDPNTGRWIPAKTLPFDIPPQDPRVVYEQRPWILPDMQRIEIWEYNERSEPVQRIVTGSFILSVSHALKVRAALHLQHLKVRVNLGPASYRTEPHLASVTWPQVASFPTTLSPIRVYCGGCTAIRTDRPWLFCGRACRQGQTCPEHASVNLGKNLGHDLPIVANFP